MILRKRNKPFEYDGKTYYIGEEIVALNNSEYSDCSAELLKSEMVQTRKPIIKLRIFIVNLIRHCFRKILKNWKKVFGFV